jgi:hypothetical protein
MQEPVYIMKDGTPVPYIPHDITTSRDAYAASLHALFKHVADFHLCIVRTFSVKYGIPEDDILKTIHDSEDFKNMQVDPAICMDVHSAKNPASNEKTKPVARIKKPKNNVSSLVEPVVINECATREPIAAVTIKTIRKKIVVPTDLFAEETETMNAIAANTNGTLMKQVLPDAPFLKTSQQIKPIQKTVVQTPLTAPATNTVAPATNTVAPATNTVAPATNTVAPATNAVAHDAPRKIIKKKTD